MGRKKTNSACSECGQQFRDRYNLERHSLAHVNRIIRNARYLCKCGYKARDNLSLKRHEMVHVPKNRRCMACCAIFETTHDALLHKKSCAKIVSCYHCGKRSVRKQFLRVHMKRHHSSTKPEMTGAAKRCPLCSKVFPTCGIIEVHLKSEHDVQMDRRQLSFDDESSFYEWKKQLENATTTFYRVYWKSKQGQEGKRRVIFRCHRVGEPTVAKDECRRRSLKLLGSNKMGAYCPAHLCVDFTGVGVDVQSLTTHVGHDFVLARLPFARELRVEIAQQIADNVPFEAILNTYQRNVDDGHLKREHLLTRKDLHNIKRDSQKWDSLLKVESKMLETSEHESIPLATEDSTARSEIDKEDPDYVCYIIAETKEIVFRQAPSVLSVQREIRETINDILELTTDPETLIKIRDAVKKIRERLIHESSCVQ